jgi:mannose/cellobiose epimerase-like protein (N-acyl-D-glucosamine 2-epimerase family)
MFVRLLAFLMLAWTLAAQDVRPLAADLPTPERWRWHLTDELMNFWTLPGPMGSPLGVFPSTVCNSGALVDLRNPCPEVGRNGWLMQMDRYLVAQSRQVYGYGVAFHLTGEPRYLNLMRAGVDHIRAQFLDRTRGGMFTLQSRAGVYGPRAELRNPQELAYGLLGLTFYYYLTREEAVLADIVRVKEYIFREYYNAQIDALQWTLESQPGQPKEDKRLTAQLDQMNAYLVMMIPLLPEPQHTQWKQDAAMLSRIMRQQFYNAEENLFFLSANRPEDLDLTKSATDFGHSIKALWMMRFGALWNGDAELVEFCETQGRRILERAFLAESGSWASGVQVGGALDRNKSWWIYAELDQFAATMSMSDPSYGGYLPRTYQYWLDRFVDRPSGEVWTTVDDRTHLPLAGDMPKAWPWKNAYHSSEHAMVAYVTTRQLNDQPVTLYYAFRELPGAEIQLRPYFYSGRVTEARRTPAGHWEVTFRDVR